MNSFDKLKFELSNFCTHYFMLSLLNLVPLFVYQAPHFGPLLASLLGLGTGAIVGSGVVEQRDDHHKIVAVNFNRAMILASLYMPITLAWSVGPSLVGQPERFIEMVFLILPGHWSSVAGVLLGGWLAVRSFNPRQSTTSIKVVQDEQQ